MGVAQPFVGRKHEIAVLRAAAERAAQGRAQFVVVEGHFGAGRTTLIREALQPWQDWPEHVISLTERRTEECDSALRSSLSTMTFTTETSATSGSAHLQVTGELSQPTVVILNELQCLDDHAVETLWNGLSTLNGGSLLVVMTLRPTPRPAMRRLIRLAQMQSYGSHIAVHPLEAHDIQEYLSRRLGMPVGRAAAEQVKQATGGFGGCVETVARHLKHKPLGRRGLGPALRSGFSDPALQQFSEELIAGIEIRDSTVQRALHLLALARRPMSLHVMEAVLGESLEPAALRATGVVGWDGSAYGYCMERDVVACALSSQLSPAEQAQLHRELSGVSSALERYRHMVSAHRLDPRDLEENQQLYRALMSAADQARGERRLDEAFEMFRMASEVSPTEQSLAETADLAAQTQRMDHLLEFEQAVRELAPSPVRAGLLALVALVENDPSLALRELGRQTVTEFDRHSLPTYASAVCLTYGQLALRGGAGRNPGIAQRTYLALQVTERELHRQYDQEGASTELEYRIGYVATLRALVGVWPAMGSGWPRDLEHSIAELTAVHQQLAAFPAAHQICAGLQMLIGIQRHQQGDLLGAYEGLIPAVSEGMEGPFAVHAKAHMALLMFGAARWEEAAQWAAAAVEGTLVQNEETTSLLAYTAWALVPAVRGEQGMAVSALRQLGEVPQPPPLVAETLCWVRAWVAIAVNDHEAAADELSAMRGCGGGGLNMGPESAALLARAQHYAGRPELLEALERTLHGDQMTTPLVRGAMLAYVRGLRAWSQESPERAYQLLDRTMLALDAEPSMSLSRRTDEGGARRFYRALLGLDMATLVTTYPEQLAHVRTVMVERISCSAAVFEQCGVHILAQQALGLRRTLRASLPSVPRRDGENAIPSAPEPAPDSFRFAYAELSPREREITHSVMRGHTNREIATELVISVRTVEYHVANVLSKFDLKSRKELRRLLRSSPEAGGAGREFALTISSGVR